MVNITARISMAVLAMRGALRDSAAMIAVYSMSVKFLQVVVFLVPGKGTRAGEL